MLTRALFALLVVCGTAFAASAEESKIVALGIAARAVTEADLTKGEALPVPHFNAPAVAYVLAANLKKGDEVHLSLNNKGASLMHNNETLAEDKASYLLLVGKQGVPAGGWPEGDYDAKVTITRAGKTLLEQASKPVPFD